MLVVSVLIFCFLQLKLRCTTFDPRGSSPDAGRKSLSLRSKIALRKSLSGRFFRS
jgi:hypothetical protein